MLAFLGQADELCFGADDICSDQWRSGSVAFRIARQVWMRDGLRVQLLGKRRYRRDNLAAASIHFAVLSALRSGESGRPDKLPGRMPSYGPVTRSALALIRIGLGEFQVARSPRPGQLGKIFLGLAEQSTFANEG